MNGWFEESRGTGEKEVRLTFEWYKEAGGDLLRAKAVIC